MKDIILIKGKQKGSVYLYEITVDDIRAIFFPKDTRETYRYLGITWNIFKEESWMYDEVDEFIKFVDSKARPRWCPKFVLRFLHLFGSDNSIVRVRSWRLYRLQMWILGGVQISDIKTKWGTIRIYGSFSDEIYKKVEELEEKINPHLEPY